MCITKAELDERIAVAKAAPAVAHLILSRGPYPTCRLCGGDGAPIVGGVHLNPEQWCQRV